MAPTSPGFTMIEVLTVLVILAILMALLLPAIFGTGRAARIDMARQRIDQIDKALKTDFHGHFGFYPPSFIVLREDGAYDDSIPAQRHSKQWLRKLWPDIQLGGTTGQEWDFDQDGLSDKTFTLSGYKCLLFFLYGMPALRKDGTAVVEVLLGTGFSTDPKNPFRRDGPRVGPFFDGLKPGDIHPGTDDDGDAATPIIFYEIADPIGNDRSLAYFSSYASLNYYRPGDCDDGTAGTQNYRAPSCPGGLTSNGPNPYTTTDPVPTDVNALAEFHHPEGFQIISAGMDGDFGIGGRFQRGAGSASYPGAADGPDADNLTNFYHAELKQAAQEGS